MAQFDDLSDYDFELLVADLLGVALGRTFETFPRGADGGIDLRAQLGNGQHYVQCKHYAKSSFAQLKRAAAKELKEAIKRGLRPRRYTFVTSHSLTAAKKTILVDTLKPLVRDQRDVLGPDDLAALLRKHPQVERAHVKLWLRGAGALERIVNAEVFARSDALVGDIMADLPRYVQTQSFSDAQDLLGAHNVVIIAGPPGVGKTTLARLLLLDSLHAGYTPYLVQSNVEEAWRLIKDEEPQVFFFDDFLGRTALFDTVSDDARDLANFIRRVRRSHGTRLVLATREYVLQTAKQTVEELKWQELDADRYSLTLDRYSRLDRARIFYNHVYFSEEVDAAACADLLKDRRYLRVIDHQAYSPRLIEWMTGLGGHRLSGKERRNFADFCVSVLDDPESLWQHAYSQGLGPSERCLLQLLPALPVNVPPSDLEEAYSAAARRRGLPSGKPAFESALRVLQDSFISIRDWGLDRISISVLNPSLIDFLKQRLVDEPAEIYLGLECAVFFEQAVLLHDLAVSASLPEGAWMSPLVAAVRRTLSTGRHGRPTPVTGSVWRHTERDHLSERLRRLAEWSEETPMLTGAMTPVVHEVVGAELEDIRNEGLSALHSWPRALARLHRAGFDIEILAGKVKDHALTFVGVIEGYEALEELRRLRPSLFLESEWQEIQGGFASWAENCLNDGPEWFEDLDEFARFEGVVAKFGVALNEEAVEEAREQVEDVSSERQARAHEDIDYEPEREGGGYSPASQFDDVEIDSLFGMLDA
jgi:hypothetical protein